MGVENRERARAASTVRKNPPVPSQLVLEEGLKKGSNNIEEKRKTRGRKTKPRQKKGEPRRKKRDGKGESENGQATAKISYAKVEDEGASECH